MGPSFSEVRSLATYKGADKEEVSLIMASGEAVLMYLSEKPLLLSVHRSGELSFLYYFIQSLHGTREVKGVILKIRSLLKNYVEAISKQKKTTEQIGYMLTHISFVCTRWGRDPSILPIKMKNWIITTIREIKAVSRKSDAEPEVLKVELELALFYLQDKMVISESSKIFMDLQTRVLKPDMHARLVANEMHCVLMRASQN